MLCKYNYTTLRGQYQAEREDTTTSLLDETKQRRYKKLYAKKQRGNKNMDERKHRRIKHIVNVNAILHNVESLCITFSLVVLDNIKMI